MSHFKPLLTLFCGISPAGSAANVDGMPLRLAKSEVLWLGGGAATLVLLSRTPTGLVEGVKSVFLILCGVWFACRLLLRRRRRAYQQRVLLHLPLVMERIVMACEAGLDTIPALLSLADVDDPVSQAFQRAAQRVSAGGVSLERALHEVADKMSSPIFRHAAVHVALAHEQGGALSGSLRELSDATQQLFEQSIDEDIATLPVKATAPLLCVFAGLLLIFVSVPLVQMSRVADAGQILGTHSSTGFLGGAHDG